MWLTWTSRERSKGVIRRWWSTVITSSRETARPAERTSSSRISNSIEVSPSAPVAPGLARRGGEPDRTPLEHFRAGSPGRVHAAEHRADAGEQLLKAERLGQIYFSRP